MKAALFDLDGTLLDTPSMIVAALREETIRVTGRRHSDDRIRALVGLPLDDIAEALADKDTDHANRIASGYRRRYIERIVPTGVGLVFPFVEVGLKQLREAGWSIGVVTSKNHQGALEILASAGLVSAIDVVVGADDVADPKPHPAPILAALKRLGVPPKYAVMVGDSRYDIQSGGRAGVRTIGVSYGVGRASDLAEAGAGSVHGSFQGAVGELGKCFPTHGRRTFAAIATERKGF